jgi:hypothetical protein
LSARACHLHLIATATDNTLVIGVSLKIDEQSDIEVFVEGHLTLINSYTLHIAEYVVLAPMLIRPNYRYHLQTASGLLVRRWDNAPHHRHIATHPDHCHHADGTIWPSQPMDLASVLVAMVPLLKY